MGQEFTRGPSGPSPISVPSRHERGHAAEAALRPQRRRPAGQSQARRRRQQLLLPPLASRLAPSLPSSAHRPATLRTYLPLPSRLRWTVDGARPLRLCRVPRAAGGQREAAAAAPPRGALMPPSQALPVRFLEPWITYTARVLYWSGPACSASGGFWNGRSCRFLRTASSRRGAPAR